MKKYISTALLPLCILFLSACEDKKEPATAITIQPASLTTPSMATSVSPTPYSNTSTQAISHLPPPTITNAMDGIGSSQLKANDGFRRSVFNRLKNLYANIQKYNLIKSNLSIIAPCLFTAVIYSRDKNVSENQKEINSCLEFVQDLKSFLYENDDKSAYYKKLKSTSWTILNDLKRFSLEENRLHFAKVALPLAQIFQSFRNDSKSTDNIDFSRLSKFLQEDLEKLLPDVLAYVFVYAHDQNTEPEFKEVYLDSILKFTAKFIRNPYILSPYSSPQSWFGNFEKEYELTDIIPALNQIYESLKSEGVNDSQIKKILNGLSASNDQILPFLSEKLESIHHVTEVLFKAGSKDEKPQGMNEPYGQLKSKTTALEGAFAALMSISDFTSSNDQTRFYSAILKIIQNQSTLGDFVFKHINKKYFLDKIMRSTYDILQIFRQSGRISFDQKIFIKSELEAFHKDLDLLQRVIPDRLTGIEVPLSKIFTLLDKSEQEFAALSNEIEKEIAATIGDLNFFPTKALDGVQYSLIQPYELLHEKCLGENTLMLSRDNPMSRDLIFECMSGFSNRALSHAYSSLISVIEPPIASEESKASKLPPEFYSGWLPFALGADAFYKRIPNLVEWSKGIIDFSMISLASSERLDSSEIIQRFKSNVADLVDFQNYISEEQLLIKAISDYYQIIAPIREEVKKMLSTFESSEVGGVNILEFPKNFLIDGKPVSSAQMAAVFGLAKLIDAWNVDFLEYATNKPYVINPFAGFSVNIELYHRQIVTAPDNQGGEYWGDIYKATYTEYGALEIGCFESSCIEATIRNIKGFMRDKSEIMMSKKNLVQPVALDTKELDKKLLDLNTNYLQPKIDSFIARLQNSIQQKFQKELTAAESQTFLIKELIEFMYLDLLPQESILSDILIGNRGIIKQIQFLQKMQNQSDLAAWVEDRSPATIEELRTFLAKTKPAFPRYVSQGIAAVDILLQVSNSGD